MYTAPNGIVFKDYWESIEYGKSVLQKEKESLMEKAGFQNIQCPNCGGEAALKGDEFYICGRCGLASLAVFEEDENED